MKKTIALLTVLAMVFTLAIPAFAQQDTGKQLEELILKVKSVIDIPADYESFNSNMGTDEDGTARWNLTWAKNADSQQYWERSNISVEIQDDGFINSYSRYDNDNKYSEIVKIPAISKDAANNAVKEFISKVCPQLEGQITCTDSSVNNGNYYFNFSRNVNGIDAKFNNASFTVNGTTGEINNYYSYWNSKIVFPPAKDIISLEKAQEIYKKNMPLDLEYRINADGKVYLQYAPSRENAYAFINAFTGEVEKPDYNYGIYREDGRGDYGYYNAMKSSITPQEQKEIDNVAGVITTAEAEKKLRSISEFNFDDSYKLSSSHLSQHKTTYNDDTIYYLSLYFSKLDDTKDLTEEQIKLKIAAGDTKGNAHATFNAKTGEVTSFSCYNYIRYGKPEAKNNTTVDSKKIADDFIAKYQPNKVGSLKYIKNDNDKLRQLYNRVENGAYFNYDAINISVDEETEKINEYNMTWTENITIPSTEGIISSDKAHEILFNALGLKMEYLYNNKKVVLAYKSDDSKAQFIDAKSGEIIDYSGEQYKEVAKPDYNDISGHFSETAVKELVNVGVFLPGESFEPDSHIVQKDYLSLLSKLGKYYYDKDNVESLYSYLIKNGIIDASEKNPDANVTRENAVKYLLRYLDYKKFAEIPGIFNCDFKDAGEIDPALVGYAAIAKGLGLINGSNDGCFKPKDILTKGESAVIIYNCLKADIK